MKYLFLALALMAPTGFADEVLPKRMGYSDLLGATATFLAKEMCSCLWVMKKSAAFCDEYTKQSPSYSKYTVNLDKKEVYSGLKKASIGGYGLYPHTARFVDDKRGCVMKK